MVEQSEHSETITMQREKDFRDAVNAYKEQPPVAPSLAQEPPLDLSKLQPFAPPSRPAVDRDEDSATVLVATDAPASAPSDPGAAFRHTRFIVTAGLVVLLIVVWVMQKRNASK